MRAGWTQITPSQHAHEREALAFLRDELPEHAPWRAWANFEFVIDGNVSEVDALVVGPHGVYLPVSCVPSRAARDWSWWASPCAGPW